MGIAGGCVVSDALCRGDWCRAYPVRYAVPWGLAVSGSCPMRCAVGIGAGRVVSDALYHCDWRVGLGGRVVSDMLSHSDWWIGCRAVGIADEGVVWAALRRCDWQGGRFVVIGGKSVRAERALSG